MWLILLIAGVTFGSVFVGIARSYQIQDEDMKQVWKKWKRDNYGG